MIFPDLKTSKPMNKPSKARRNFLSESKPVITRMGSEDCFCGAWHFGGRDGALPFAHLNNGAHPISTAQRTGGRYCLYRCHADNSITFKKHLKHTIEEGRANDRADCFYSVVYWYQSEPYTNFPALPSVGNCVPVMKVG